MSSKVLQDRRQKIDNLHWDTFLVLADTFIPAVDADVIRPFVHPKYGVKAEQIAGLCPSVVEGFVPAVKTKLMGLDDSAIGRLALLLTVLSYRATAFAFTRSPWLLTEMSAADREVVVQRWPGSPIPALRQTFKSLLDLTSYCFLVSCPKLFEAAGHPGEDARRDVEASLQSLGTALERDHYLYTMLDLGQFTTEAEIEVDVVICGSGGGGGVSAYNLTKAGYRVLVLEKGQYYDRDQIEPSEGWGYENLFERGGAFPTRDTSMVILAGSTLGGGTTINWSASLKTPDVIRRQWVDKGATMYGDRVYDEAMNRVMSVMGCSTAGIDHHSFTNQLLLDSSTPSGLPDVALIDQNTAGQVHNCGLCGFGCKLGMKQGGVVCWLRHAAETGLAQFVDRTQVLEITHSRGKASGVVARVNDKIRLTVRAKRVIVACGSLQTPGLLMRSNFKNKHIGRGLKLHPATGVNGEYPHVDMDHVHNPIMTVVNTTLADLDGRAHGSRLEALYQQPSLHLRFSSWTSGEKHRQDMLKYQHLASILILARDSTNGTISYAKDDPFHPVVDYSLNRRDWHSMLVAVVAAAKIHYIGGATHIIAPHLTYPVFESFRAKDKRTLTDPEFVAWASKLERLPQRSFDMPLGSAHQMASCRMGGKPSSSAVDPLGRLWECRNVFVADTSVFPSASGVNPMITVMATADVISRTVVDELRSEAVSVRPRL